MVSTTNISATTPLMAEIKTRMKIAVFMVLLWQFTRVVVYPVAQNAALLYSLYALLEISSMVVIYRLTGNSRIGKDLNEFNLYAFIIHIVGIPIYYLTEIPLEVHDYSIWALFILSIVRLFYIHESKNGEFKGIPTLSLLRHIQKIGAAFNHWSELLFFGSAMPLWFIVYKTNERPITIAAVGLMVFIYLITDAMKTQSASVAEANASNGELNSDAALLLKIFNDKSIEEKAHILKLVAIDFDIVIPKKEVAKPKIKQETEIFTEESFTIIELRNYLKMFGAVILVLMILFPITIDHYQATFFDTGYASGYSDAKSSVPPKKETDFRKVLDCVFEANTKMPPPPGKGCLDKK
jgi:hypothetical protein